MSRHTSAIPGFRLAGVTSALPRPPVLRTPCEAAVNARSRTHRGLSPTDRGGGKSPALRHEADAGTEGAVSESTVPPHGEAEQPLQTPTAMWARRPAEGAVRRLACRATGRCVDGVPTLRDGLDAAACHRGNAAAVARSPYVGVQIFDYATLDLSRAIDVFAPAIGFRPRATPTESGTQCILECEERRSVSRPLTSHSLRLAAPAARTTSFRMGQRRRVM